MNKSKYERAVFLATTVCLILLGIAFIGCVAHLYFTGGDQPFSRESVGGYLKILAIPSVITIGLVIAGVIMRYINNSEDDEATPRTKSELLESFEARYDIECFKGQARELISKERHSRNLFESIAYAFSALIFVLVLAYMIFFAEFTVETLNADVMAALTVALPLCAIALGIHVPRVYLAEASCERELAAMKEYIKENGTAGVKKNERPDAKRLDPSLILKYVILAASVVFIILGVVNGGMDDVLAKAVKICTECIGLG